ncbi:hypothetical protein CCHR01_10486 [Colletotrichum chrysophilum]|uniref:Uncharacterized protein n=1 Tax=Colletotrichum chrysophilum TaxID=1836956 RepID=A0AAD9AHR6_9PEZI|nr:hypothetical protein CCHR01_10486 [Colletotrichum chrysophilum]
MAGTSTKHTKGLQCHFSTLSLELTSEAQLSLQKERAPTAGASARLKQAPSSRRLSPAVQPPIIAPRRLLSYGSPRARRHIRWQPLFLRCLIHLNDFTFTFSDVNTNNNVYTITT